MIIILEVLTGVLLGRAVAYTLTGIPTTVLRRFVTLLLVVLCCGSIAVAWYLNEADVRHIVYAAALGGLVGFVLSQRTDRTVRLATCCLAAPIVILTALSLAFFACEQYGVVDWDDVTVLYSYQTALLTAVPIALVVSILWYVPNLLWKTRDRTLQGQEALQRQKTLRAIGAAVVASVCLAALLSTHDFIIRRKIANLRQDAAERGQELYGAPPTVDENAAYAYQQVVDAFDIDHDVMDDLATSAESFASNRTFAKYQPLLNQLKAAASHPGRFYLPDELLDRHDEFFPEIFTLSLGLIARAQSLVDANAEAASEDVKAVRRIQRHLASDPRASTSRDLAQLELRLRPVLEQLPPSGTEGLLNQVPFSDLDSQAEFKQQQFLSRLLRRHYVPTPSRSSWARAADRWMHRLLWARQDIECVSNLDDANLYMPIPRSEETMGLFSEYESATEFHSLAAVNDVGLFAKQFYASHERAPAINDLSLELGSFLGKDAWEVIAIRDLTNGCVVSLLGEDDELIQALADAETGPGTTPSRALSAFGTLRAGRVFLVGEPLKCHRTTQMNVEKQKSQYLITLIAPQNAQVFALLSGIRRDQYSEALAEVRVATESKYRHQFHDDYGVLGSVLNELCQLEDDDGPWFFESNGLVVSRRSRANHRLAFWSLEDMQLRDQLLSDVHRDTFDDAFEQVHWDFGTPFDEQNAQKTWNQLSELADFIESALIDGRPIVCITVE